MKTRQTSFVFTILPTWVLLSSIILACNYAVAQNINTAEGFTVRPGVIVDSPASTLFLMTPEGELEALTIPDGFTLWKTRQAAKPLTIVGSLLLAQAESTNLGQLNLVVLDITQDGAKVRDITVELPAVVDTSIDDGLGRVFNISARPFEGAALLSWDFTQQRISGMRLSAEQERNGLVQASASVLVDLFTGTIDNTDSRLATLTSNQIRPDVPSEQRLPGLPVNQFISAAENHILASEQVAENDVFEKYRWSIVTTPTGAVVGTLPAFTSTAPFFVAESTIIHESRPNIHRVANVLLEEDLLFRAVDLTTGSERWRRPLRDTSYRGPFPP